MTLLRRAAVVLVTAGVILPFREAGAQSSSEAGKPFFNCFRMNEYRGGSQNWQFLQDDRGVVYIGNNFGVLEYDGASWRMIRTPARNVIRSLSADENGRIYVGAFSEFGYLDQDEVGALEFVQLEGLLSEADIPFADVWTTHATPDGIYFQTRERLFRLKPLTAEPGPDRAFDIVVQGHGGSLTVDSDDRGATFVVSLPVARSG